MEKINMKKIMMMVSLAALALNTHAGTMTSWEYTGIDLGSTAFGQALNAVLMDASSASLTVYLMPTGDEKENFWSLVNAFEANPHEMPDIVGYYGSDSADILGGFPSSMGGVFESDLASGVGAEFYFLYVFHIAGSSLFDAPYADVVLFYPAPEKASGSHWGELEIGGNSNVNSFLFDSGVTIKQYFVIPIPEPATGLLALAGIALLIRRKRK